VFEKSHDQTFEVWRGLFWQRNCHCGERLDGKNHLIEDLEGLKSEVSNKL